MDTTESQKCSHCKNIKSFDLFKATARGLSSRCLKCLEDKKAAYAANKEAGAIDKATSLPSLDDTLLELEIVKQDEVNSHSLTFNARARVAPLDQIPLSPPRNSKSSSRHMDKNWRFQAYADVIAARIWDVTEYRWTYHENRRRKGEAGEWRAHLFEYNCAQLDTRQKKPRKIDDVDKRREKQQMTTFPCNGWLTITLEELDEATTIEIILKHEDDHVPYCPVTVPRDVLLFIEKEQAMPIKDIWAEVLKRHPNPSFTRQAVFHHWQEINSRNWKLDENAFISAHKLLEKGEDENGISPGSYRIEIIDIPVNDDYETLAFSVPKLLEEWRERMREFAMDSAWKCSAANWELFVLMGEAYGSGLALSWLFVRSKGGKPKTGSKEQILTYWLAHLKSKWNLKATFTLSDKDFSEINAMVSVFVSAKHQLCFWHFLRAIKTRLAILRRQPAQYDVKAACREFQFIDPKFLPIAQFNQLPEKEREGIDTTAVETKIPNIRVRLGGKLVGTTGTISEHSPAVSSKDSEEEQAAQVQTSDPKDQMVSMQHITRAVIEDAGDEVVGSDYELEKSKAPENLLMMVEEEVVKEGQSKTMEKSDHAPCRAIAVAKVWDADAEVGTDKDADVDNEDGGWPEGGKEDEEWIDEEEMDQEDAPDWMFDDNETRAKDPAYIFCPAAHRTQILRLVTRHFCRHTLFLYRANRRQTPSEIRESCVRQMYAFCKTRGLREVWAYLWNQWYRPAMWKLWARSSLSTFISRLRTTMVAENHWNIIKHQHLHFMTRPRLDLTVYTLITGVVPTHIEKSNRLRNLYRAGRAKSLTVYQKAFKKAWHKLSALPKSSTNYNTNVQDWTCECGSQELQAHHLCKHLVQAAGNPPASFFTDIRRRRTVPIYRHSFLRNTVGDDEKASFTDGDDQFWSGHRDILHRGKWRQALHEESSRKRERSLSGSSVELLELKKTKIDAVVTDYDENVEEMSDTEELHENENTIRIAYQYFLRAAGILQEQLESFAEPAWIRHIVHEPVITVAAKHAKVYVDQVSEHEKRPNIPTWGGNSRVGKRKAKMLLVHHLSSSPGPEP